MEQTQERTQRLPNEGRVLPMRSDLSEDKHEEGGRPPSVDDVVCPICRRRMFSCDGSVVRLRTRILVFEGTCAIAKCKYCRNDVVVPVVLCGSSGTSSLPMWDEELDDVRE